MNAVLAWKLALVPSLIAGITVAARRWGPEVAGWLSAFPVVSGPILLFVALAQGASFAASAALGTLSAVLAILSFGLSYSWSATRYPWWACAIIGFAAYFLSIGLLNFWTPSLLPAMGVVLGVLIVIPRIYPVPMEIVPSASTTSARGIGARMLASAGLVVVVTHFSSQLGAHLSGLFAMFPAMGSILAIFSHRETGPAFTIRMMRGMITGYYSFACFCSVLVLALPRCSIPAAFLLAIGTAALTHTISRLAVRPT